VRIIDFLKRPRAFLLGVVLLYSSSVSGQVSVQDTSIFNRYNAERLTHSRNGMIALGSWGIGNMIVGGIGMATTSMGSEANIFHQVNIYWNVVNVAIAIPGYFGVKKGFRKSFTVSETFEQQRKQETVYLLNFGLDLGYIGTGVFLREFGNRYTGTPRNVLKGSGSSVIMQGGFLMLYDLTMWIVHRAHWKKNKTEIWERIELGGTSIRYHF
jgi:hypothetical protein